jgi:hypothetical protein
MNQPEKMEKLHRSPMFHSELNELSQVSHVDKLPSLKGLAGMVYEA